LRISTSSHFKLDVQNLAALQPEGLYQVLFASYKGRARIVRNDSSGADSSARKYKYRHLIFAYYMLRVAHGRFQAHTSASMFWRTNGAHISAFLVKQLDIAARQDKLNNFLVVCFCSDA
jgi:hypothetical protein